MAGNRRLDLRFLGMNARSLHLEKGVLGRGNSSGSHNASLRSQTVMVPCVAVSMGKFGTCMFYCLCPSLLHYAIRSQISSLPFAQTETMESGRCKFTISAFFFLRPLDRPFLLLGLDFRFFSPTLSSPIFVFHFEVHHESKSWKCSRNVGKGNLGSLGFAATQFQEEDLTFHSKALFAALVK